MNLKTLVPNSERTAEQLQEMGKKGGIESGKAKRKKKTLKDNLTALLDADLTDAEIRRRLEHKGYTNEISNSIAISISLLQKALNGDVRAYEVIRDTIGEKPTEYNKVDIRTNSQEFQQARAEIDAYIKEFRTRCTTYQQEKQALFDMLEQVGTGKEIIAEIKRVIELKP